MSCTLILLPGMDGTGELFAPLVRELGPYVPTRVVRYPDRPLDYAAHEECARAALPTDRPFVVLGESFSGPIAISIAASAPPGMRGYILSASFVCAPGPNLARLRRFYKYLVPQRMPRAVASYLLLGRYATPALREVLASALDMMSVESMVARLHAIASVDVRAEAQRVRMPGLYLRASEDRILDASAAQLFMQHAAGARVVDIAGPHCLLLANPRAAACVLTQTLAEWGARAD
ncbi:MAG TPA: alpha/beta fold hydrolase [Steroidobacteraceae bacterium]|nr:alpha/beta fold hydrolase [Steroidobacteraceae bacterium]HVX90239.1 alpha/beta fold hydrolase [Candidatus Paceibacterota bacterium]